MKIFRFDPEVGKAIDAYNSSGFVISRITHSFDEVFVNCAGLDANGVIGYHQAAASQLFLVVQGEGWVRGGPLERTSIRTGHAAFWNAGEWHETGTSTGMMAIIIEGVNLDLTKLTPLMDTAS